MAEASLSCFSERYSDARDKFLRAAERIPGVRFDKWVHPTERGPAGEELSIDVAILEGDGEPRAVLVHSSGLHGIEGYAGSAIQIAWLSRMADRIESGEAAVAPGEKIILIHAVNPFGMAWFRRFNASNVDLNRNFHDDERFRMYEASAERGAFTEAERLYQDLDAMINPAEPVGACDCFYLKAAWYILWHGFSSIRRAVANGQHFDPDGLYFGGLRFEDEGRYVRSLFGREGVGKHNRHLDTLVHVDVHTGLGPSGFGSLFVDPEEGGDTEVAVDTVRRMVGVDPAADKALPDDCRRVVALGTGVVSYSIEGAFTEFTRKAVVSGLRGAAGSPDDPDIPPEEEDASLSQERNLVTVAQEFGTVGNVSVFRGLRVEHAQYRHNHHAPLESAPKQELRSVFYRDEPTWRRSVLDEGLWLLDSAWAYVQATASTTEENAPSGAKMPRRRRRSISS